MCFAFPSLKQPAGAAIKRFCGVPKRTREEKPKDLGRTKTGSQNLCPPQPEVRNPNSRNPKEARNPKAEPRFGRLCETVLAGHLSEGNVSDFFRISDFGLRILG